MADPNDYRNISAWKQTGRFVLRVIEGAAINADKHIECVDTTTNRVVQSYNRHSIMLAVSHRDYRNVRDVGCDGFSRT